MAGSSNEDSSHGPPLPGGERAGVRGARRTKLARTLRQKQTDAERKMWRLLRGRRLDGLKFKRQAPIGRFVVDFVCPEHHLIVELDGGGHTYDAPIVRDADRTAQLEAMGYVVMRFWNRDVLKRTPTWC